MRGFDILEQECTKAQLSAHILHHLKINVPNFPYAVGSEAAYVVRTIDSRQYL